MFTFFTGDVTSYNNFNRLKMTWVYDIVLKVRSSHIMVLAELHSFWKFCGNPTSLNFSSFWKPYFSHSSFFFHFQNKQYNILKSLWPLTSDDSLTLTVLSLYSSYKDACDYSDSTRQSRVFSSQHNQTYDFFLQYMIVYYGWMAVKSVPGSSPGLIWLIWLVRQMTPPSLGIPWIFVLSWRGTFPK